MLTDPGLLLKLFLYKAYLRILNCNDGWPWASRRWLDTETFSPNGGCTRLEAVPPHSLLLDESSLWILWCCLQVVLDPFIPVPMTSSNKKGGGCCSAQSMRITNPAVREFLAECGGGIYFFKWKRKSIFYYYRNISVGCLWLWFYCPKHLVTGT